MNGDYVRVISQRGHFLTRGRLIHLKERLASSHFVQISRQSVINTHHLQRMEASFSGNMLAILSRDTRLSVSRRYVKALEKQIGL